MADDDYSHYWRHYYAAAVDYVWWPVAVVAVYLIAASHTAIPSTVEDAVETLAVPTVVTAKFAVFLMDCSHGVHHSLPILFANEAMAMHFHSISHSNSHLSNDC